MTDIHRQLMELHGLVGGRDAIGELGAVARECQQPHAVTERRAYQSTVRREAELLDVAGAEVGLLDIVC